MTIKLNNIIRAIKKSNYRVSDHADEEAQDDKIKYDEIFNSVINGEIIEQYPEDQPYPSCLILGYTFANDPIHSVWGYNEENGWAVLITVYRPDPDLWIDFKIRKNKA